MRNRIQRPVLRIGQTTNRPVLTMQLRRSDDEPGVHSEPADLTDATVEISAHYQTSGQVAVEGDSVDVVDDNDHDPADGYIRYQFDESQLPTAGRVVIQFLVTYDDGDTEAFPAGGYYYVDVGPVLGGDGPQVVEYQRITAEEGVFEHVQLDSLTATGTIDTLSVGDFDADTITADRTNTNTIGGGVTPTGTITDLTGEHLARNESGELSVVFPPEGDIDPADIPDHDHSASGEGGHPLHPARLRSAQEPVFNVKHPQYGAVGDGVTDDAPAIQAAIDAASTNGGGVVYLPPGTYRLSEENTALLLADNIAIIGAGRFQSQFKPDFSDDEEQRIYGWLSGSDVENVELAHFGIDGSESEANYLDPDSGPDAGVDYSEVVIGQWANINFRGFSTVSIHHLWANHVKHIVDARDGNGLSIHDLMYRDCFDGPHVSRSEGIVISQLNGQNVSTIQDFANCERAVVIGATGTANAWGGQGTDRLEGFDSGASSHILYSNLNADGFEVGLRLKAESGNPFSEITISDSTFTQCSYSGVELGQTSGISGARTVKISNCQIHSDITESVGVRVTDPVVGVEISDCTIDVIDDGILAIGSRISSDDNDIISREARALRVFDHSDGTVPQLNLTEGRYQSRSDSVADGVIRITRCPNPRLMGFDIRNSDGRAGIVLENCQAPQIGGGFRIQDVRQHGIEMRWDSETSLRTGGAATAATVQNGRIEDWGLGGSRRGGVMFEVDNITTAIAMEMVNVKNVDMFVSNANVASQEGIYIQSGGSVTELAYSDLSDNVMINVQSAIADQNSIIDDTTVETDNVVKTA